MHVHACWRLLKATRGGCAGVVHDVCAAFWYRRSGAADAADDLGLVLYLKLLLGAKQVSFRLLAGHRS